jgi:hypothetical protein
MAEWPKSWIVAAWTILALAIGAVGAHALWH